MNRDGIRHGCGSGERTTVTDAGRAQHQVSGHHSEDAPSPLHSEDSEPRMSNPDPADIPALDVKSVQVPTSGFDTEAQ